MVIDFLKYLLFAIFALFVFFFISQNQENRSLYGLNFSHEIPYKTLYQKIDFVFYYLYFLGRIHVCLSKNPHMGFFAYICSVFIYLYFLWCNSFLIHLRILILSLYSIFLTYLKANPIENKMTLFPTKLPFFSLRQQILDKKVQENGHTLSLVYTVIIFLLFWWDSYMKTHIEKVENLCNDRLKEMGESLNYSDVKRYTELKELEQKKENIFRELDKNFFYYKSSLYIFSFLKKPHFQVVSDQIQKVYEKKDSLIFEQLLQFLYKEELLQIFTFLSVSLIEGKKVFLYKNI